MKIVSKLMLLTTFALLVTNAQAELLKCTSLDPSNKLDVTYNSDPNNQTVLVNGETHKIVAATKDRSGVATDNFTINNALVVYDSFIKNDNDYTLHRFNAMTDETIFKIKLKCELQKQQA